MSIYHTEDNKFGVCNRHHDLRSSYNNAYWKIVRKLDLFDFGKIKRQCKLFGTDTKEDYTIVIQGELCGPGIQRNLLDLRDIKFFVFNIWIDGELLGLEGMLKRCKQIGLDTVPIEERDIVFNHSLEWLVERAKGKYEGTKNEKEGIVVRPMHPILSPTLRWNPLTFSVKSPSYSPK